MTAVAAAAAAAADAAAFADTHTAAAPASSDPVADVWLAALERRARAGPQTTFDTTTASTARGDRRDREHPPH